MCALIRLRSHNQGWWSHDLKQSSKAAGPKALVLDPYCLPVKAYGSVCTRTNLKSTKTHRLGTTVPGPAEVSFSLWHLFYCPSLCASLPTEYQLACISICTEISLLFFFFLTIFSVSQLDYELLEGQNTSLHFIYLSKKERISPTWLRISESPRDLVKNTDGWHPSLD